MNLILARALTGLAIMFPTVLLASFSACSATPSRNGGVGGSGAGGASGVTSVSHATGTTSTASATSNSSGISLTTSASSSGGKSGDGGCGMTVMSQCKTNADCDDGDPSTIDTCIISGTEVQIGTCVHVACDGGPSCTMQAVDPTCNLADAGIVYPPYVPLNPPDVPATCANGFEVCDALGAPPYVIVSKSPSGSQALTLDLDFATYTAPDGLLITGVDGNCKPYVLFDSCRIRTADLPEHNYTDGGARPLDTTIRQFHLTLEKGTTQLTFDFSRVVSPMYFQVLGLCDFALPPAPGVAWFSLVP
jgi:hypothetical protein